MEVGGVCWAICFTKKRVKEWQILSEVNPRRDVFLKDIELELKMRTASF